MGQALFSMKNRSRPSYSTVSAEAGFELVLGSSDFDQIKKKFHAFNARKGGSLMSVHLIANLLAALYLH